MEKSLVFDPDLLRRYDRAGPRYTSYPTANRFQPAIGPADYLDWVRRSNEEPIPRPLSLYVHIPFCDTLCFYCACNKIATKNRARVDPYLELVERELSLHGPLYDADRQVEQVHWGGGTPTFLNDEQMRRLMSAIARHFNVRAGEDTEFSIEIDPRAISPSRLILLRDLGFNRISIGVQDFNPEVQKAVNRIQGVEETAAVVAAARANGFRSVNMDLIYGLPHQTTESFATTLDQVLALEPDRLAIYNYAHLPEIFPPQRRINADDLPSPAEKLDILQLAVQKLTARGYVYIGMDHFARPDDNLAIALKEGTLHRNFQGYSDHADCDLIGIGVSAIGKVCENYYQNAHDMEAWTAALEENRLPIKRGIELEPDDRLRATIISSLMCQFAVDIPQLERRWRFHFWTHFAAERGDLEVMQRDGLLELGEDRITVLPAGRMLVRNICMVFDRYLREEGTSTGSRVI